LVKAEGTDKLEKVILKNMDPNIVDDEEEEGEEGNSLIQ